MHKILIPPVFVFLSIVIILLSYFLLPHYNFIPFPFNFSGLMVVFGGITIMGKARDLFKKHNTTLAIEPASNLIREGIYAHTRNPMYIGMFLLLMGIAICFGNLAALFSPVLFILLVSIVIIPKEEKMMQESFGEAYKIYCSKVRRWL